MKQLTDIVVAYKLVWVRVFFYFFLPAGTLFLTQTETLSDEGWSHMGPFLKWRLAAQCFIAGSTALVAYIDSSRQRAQNNYETLQAKREAETTFKAKTETTTPPTP